MSTEIGKFDRQIDIKERTTTRDAKGGGFKDTFTTKHENVPCQVDYRRGREKVEQDRKTARTYVDFHIRYIEGIQPDWTIFFDDMVYDIEKIVVMGRRERQIITAYVRF